MPNILAIIKSPPKILKKTIYVWTIRLACSTFKGCMAFANASRIITAMSISPGMANQKPSIKLRTRTISLGIAPFGSDAASPHLHD